MRSVDWWSQIGLGGSGTWFLGEWGSLGFGYKIAIFKQCKVGVMCSWSESQKSRFRQISKSTFPAS